MRNSWLLPVTFALLIAVPISAQARLVTVKGVNGKTPAAIVETVSGQAGGLERYQILWEEDVFELEKDEQVILSYFDACRLETITGGRVEIGPNGSVVEGGKLETGFVNCDGGPIAVAWMACAFEGDKLAENRRLLVSTFPLLIVYGQDEGVITVERMDTGATPYRVSFRDGVLDFAETAFLFEPGGKYRFQLEGHRSVAYASIWSGAKPKPDWAIGRFLGIPTDSENGRNCR